VNVLTWVPIDPNDPELDHDWVEINPL
jgi:hypothetical protein